jgi:3-methyladenine DNA glycosylase AlkD
MNTKSILQDLKALGNPANLPGMARYGIVTDHAYGINLPVLRKYAKPYKGNHDLALELWNSGIHEARLMASMIDHPKFVTEDQMEKWAHDFDSWDVCDQVCGNLFKYTPMAFDKAMKWSHAKEEYVKRAGFVLMAVLALKTIKWDDHQYEPFFKRIEKECTDERNFVKKAVNWALRQLGKRNKNLHKNAMETAEKIVLMNSKSAKWIGKDALRELEGKTDRA